MFVLMMNPIVSFWLFSQKNGKMVYGTYFLPTDTNLGVNKLVFTCNKFSNRESPW